MILRAAIVLLLMLNLGAAAWWWLGSDAAASAPAHAARNTSDAPSLRLLSEAAPAPAIPPAAAITASASPPVAASTESSVATAATTGQCLRFGPFADAAVRDAARPALAAVASSVAARDMPGRASRGWWVFLPPLPSRDEARAVGERIKAAGIKDWYVMGAGDQANSVALGRYGSENAARRREAELRAKGFAAQAAPLGDRAPQWWLDARIAAGTDRAALAVIAPSGPIECTGLR